MDNERYQRQSFLGHAAEEIFSQARVAVIGLGGGGSHIVQQLAHIGFKQYVIYDYDVVAESNLNRLVGATDQDVKDNTLKIRIATRVIRNLQANAKIEAIGERWQDNPLPLRACDLIFGCVDSFSERHEIEVCARRYLMPYIDIGMDVRHVAGEPPRMAGQVILSMPGGPCMWCMNFLNQRVMQEEATRYGAAGPRPQVVWPNGILASAAVGIAVDLLTDWTKSTRNLVYLSYDGNESTLTPHIRVKYINSAICHHYSMSNIGDPILKKV